MIKKIFLAIIILLSSNFLLAQSDSTNSNNNSEDADIETLLGEIENGGPQKYYARYAFKSTRVIMGQSMEMLGAGVLDFRILHRFGTINQGVSQLFGLDQASMRMSFDYGIIKNLGIGIGRSTLGKDLDGFIKWRIAHQHTGVSAIPLSIIYVAGTTIDTRDPDPSIAYFFTNRMAFFHQLILGRKFNNSFTLQITPTLLHRNIVDSVSDKNDMYALGIGSRIRLTKRTSFILDAFPQVYGYDNNVQKIPISIGFDIETGGHVFQLHFSNARGMNERAILSETNQLWTKGQIQFGFNLSRVFTIVKNKSS